MDRALASEAEDPGSSPGESARICVNKKEDFIKVLFYFLYICYNLGLGPHIEQSVILPWGKLQSVQCTVGSNGFGSEANVKTHVAVNNIDVNIDLIFR